MHILAAWKQPLAMLSVHALTPPLPLLPTPSIPVTSHRTILTRHAEIYRIVSSKALDQGDGGQAVLGEGRKVIEISKSADADQKKGCC